ncbi:MAG: tetratricopeptide repeat protein [Nitrospirota bacterium]
MRLRGMLYLLLLQTSLTLACLLAVSPAAAEVRMISATGEYRMGDNDTKTDAKRLALLDAKRLALERAGTYLEGVTQVKNLQITTDELRAYTAGIVEVVEQATRTEHEGETSIVRVDVTVKVDTEVVARQIESLRKREHAKEELAQAREENERLRQEVETKTRELAALKSKTGAEALLKEREQMLTKLDANDLVVQAMRVPAGSRDGLRNGEPASKQDRAAKKALLQQAVALDPTNPRAHATLARLLQVEGDQDGAIREYREALRLKPGLARAHAGLGQALLSAGRKDEAAREFRIFLRTVPQTPENERLIVLVKKKLRELGYLDLPAARPQGPQQGFPQVERPEGPPPPMPPPFPPPHFPPPGR